MLHEVIEYATRRSQFMARQLIGWHGFTEGDFEDLWMDLLTDALARLPKFDRSRPGFKTFVRQLIEHRIATLIKHRRAACRNPARAKQSLDVWTRDQDGQWVKPGQMHPDNVAARRLGTVIRSRQEQIELVLDTATVMKRLSPDDRRLCRQLMNKTPSQISRETGVRRATLYERMQLIRPKFVQAGLEKYL
jgi:RNA polymerase sigma factor (sigma-70 family)